MPWQLIGGEACVLCNFAKDETGARLLRSYGRGAEQIVEAVLQDAERPLHFTEIAEQASKRGKRPVDVRRAHNAAATVGLLFGRGTYGMAKHLSLDTRTLEALADEAEELVADGACDRQWHVSEILAALIERGADAALSADKYLVDIAL